ncbi:MAG: AIR synthase-related protein [Candidatus Shapirobacteria bacterium]|nr:AIR synthase-related protein [Candidatus Shapirobacteria bacterium]
MAVRIEIGSKISDTRAVVKKASLSDLVFFDKLESLELVDVHTIDKKISEKDLRLVMVALVSNVSQEVGIKVCPKEFSWAIEVGFLPGVTDNVANTAKEITEDLLKTKFEVNEGWYTSQITFVIGNLSENEIRELSLRLYNPLIQRVLIKSYSQYQRDGGMDLVVPKVKLDDAFKILNVDLEKSDDELTVLGKVGILDENGLSRGPLALDLTYMKAIRDYFRKEKRCPTDIELETIAQTWSEHCKHTIFANKIDELNKGLFKEHIKAATEKIRKNKGKKDFCVSVFTDNSGAIDFDEEYLITHKVETHNSPSALDPFGGSITGIVGVNRDAMGFGMGAKPVANVYGFCLTDPEDKTELYRDAKLTQKMLSADRIMSGVIAGVNSGGNQSGIPTDHGFLYFDKDYRGKPLVFCGTLGLIPRKFGKKKLYEKKANPGDLIVMIGGRVGKDGIHGATFSSELLDSGSPATAVQIGDPITQKKMSDALIKEARDLGLYTSITDDGAGGLSSSVAEMAKETDGCIVELDKVPLKYPGLEPWQIWISESQERMTLAVEPKKWNEFKQLMERRGVEATVIGEFTDSGKCVGKFKGQTVMDLDMDFLHNGLPPRPMLTEKPDFGSDEPKKVKISDWNKEIVKKLKDLNLTGFEFLSSQYDHEVQGGSVLKPLQGRGRVNSETSVFRPVLISKKAVALSSSLYPEYSNKDAYWMTACSIDTAIRNVVSVGANPDKIAILDNFCWCDSRNPKRLGQLKQATQAAYDFSIDFGTPFISGKDSMFNDFSGFDDKGKPLKISVPPTLLISSMSVINDVNKVVSIDLKFSGDLIYVLGGLTNKLGNVPSFKAKVNLRLYRSVFKAIQKCLISSSVSVGRGGLVMALAKTVMAGMLGADINIDGLNNQLSTEDVLLADNQGCLLVSVDPKKQKDFEEVMKGNKVFLLGRVSDKDDLNIRDGKKKLTEITVDKLLKSYRSTFKNF